MLAIIIFTLTLLGILFRPFNLKIWLFSSLGAGAAVALQLVDFGDLRLIFSLIWDSALTLIALIIISFCLQALGFFEWLIFYTLKLCQRLSRSKNSINSTLNSANLNLNSTKKAEFLDNENSQSQNSCLNSALNSTNSAPNKLTINSKTLFIALCVLAFLCSGVLANDGAILILTPLVLGLFLRAKSTTTTQLAAFLFAVAFLCDTSSNALIISNLSNIITANYFKLDFTDFALEMFLPNLLAFAAALALFLLVFRKDLKGQTIFKIPSKPKLKTKFFALYLVLLVLFVASFFVSRHFRLPLSVNCLAFAALLLGLLWAKSPKKAFNSLKNAPFGIIIFSFTLFVVVLSLTKLDIQSRANSLFSVLLQDDFVAVFGIGTLSALGASLFNNLPMVLFGDLILNDFFVSPANSSLQAFKETLIYAHLLGCNIGSKLTPIGSLCTLLWLSLLAKKGVNFSLKTYLKFSLIFTFPVLFAALLPLCLG